MHDWMAEARALHSESVVIDLHADTPQRFVDERFSFAEDELRGGQISLATARSGGIDGEFFAAWCEPTEWVGRYAERTRSLIASVHAQVAAHPEAMAFCRNAAEIVAAEDAGKFAALIGVEGGHSIEGRIDLLEEYFASGVRYMTLTWSNTNEWADSSSDVPRHNGLTDFGREVVRTMQRLGMIVDVSHVSDKTFWDVMEISEKPVIASHSSARALTTAGRNLTDEMMRAIAASGGVIGVNFFPAFIDERWRAEWNALKPQRVARQQQVALPYRQRGQPVPFHISDGVDREFALGMRPAPLDSLLDHFEHVLSVVGAEHVAMGSDFDGIPLCPEGIDSAADLVKVTAGLMERGVDAASMKKILGENVLRVLG